MIVHNGIARFPAGKNASLTACFSFPCFPRFQQLGVKDFRLTKVAVGTNGPGTMKAVQAASLPELPYSLKKFFTGKETKSAPEVHKGGSMPGYTGHQHAGQHVYGMSYGHTTRRLQEDPNQTMQERSDKFIGYADWRPPGEILAEKGKKIPGYQGFIPAKDNHVFGKTYGNATMLAPEAEAAMRAGGNAAAMTNLVETRPIGGPDMYAEAHQSEVPYKPEPLPYRVSKGVVRINFKEQGNDKKWRNVVPDDIKEVQEARHRIVGYTGHTHGAQHVYGESVGKLTRRLHGGKTNLNDPHTSYDLLNYKDARPNYEDKNAPNCL